MSTIWNGGLFNLHLKCTGEKLSVVSWFALPPGHAGEQRNVINFEPTWTTRAQRSKKMAWSNAIVFVACVSL